MTIQRVHFKNFTAFDDTIFNCSPSINVLIGANSTGKTHSLRCCCRSLVPPQWRPQTKRHADQPRQYPPHHEQNGRLRQINGFSIKCAHVIQLWNWRADIVNPFNHSFLGPLPKWMTFCSFTVLRLNHNATKTLLPILQISTSKSACQQSPPQIARS